VFSDAGRRPATRFNTKSDANAECGPVVLRGITAARNQCLINKSDKMEAGNPPKSSDRFQSGTSGATRGCPISAMSWGVHGGSMGVRRKRVWPTERTASRHAPASRQFLHARHFARATRRLRPTPRTNRELMKVRADALKFRLRFKISGGERCFDPVTEKQSPSQNDKCPHCQVLLEIVGLKIGLTRVTMHAICPNCGMVQAEDPDKTNRSKRRRRGQMSLLGKRR